MLHLYGRSPVCERICIWTAESEPNIFPHNLQRCLNDEFTELDDDDDDDEDEDDEDEDRPLFSLYDELEDVDEVEDLSENFFTWFKLRLALLFVVVVVLLLLLPFITLMLLLFAGVVLLAIEIIWLFLL